jgi:hypothetical protein
MVVVRDSQAMVASFVKTWNIQWKWDHLMEEIDNKWMASLPLLDREDALLPGLEFNRAPMAPADSVGFRVPDVMK